MPRRRIHPLIDALVAHLPPPGGEWPEQDRRAWIEMLTMALNVVYGGGSQPAPKPPKPVKPKMPEIPHPFIVDEQGFVKRKTGERVLPKDVTGSIFDMRGALSDLRTMVWADDSTGLNGQDLVICS